MRSLKAYHIAALALLLASCSSQNPDKHDLLSSVIRLDTAIDQGVTLVAFSNLVLDARSKFRMAMKSLPANDAKTIDVAITTTEEAKTVWSALIQSDQHFSDDLFQPMKNLGIVADRAEFDRDKTIDDGEIVAKDYVTDASGGLRKVYIQIALSACHNSLNKAQQLLQPAG